jgi:hypothetical protein
MHTSLVLYLRKIGNKITRAHRKEDEGKGKPTLTEDHNAATERARKIIEIGKRTKR